MNEVFVISDTHFGHKKILEFESAARPFSSIQEHDEELVQRWNSVVGKKDQVWHLGDVLFGAGSFVLLSRLNGFKRLVMGNHDQYPVSRYLEHFRELRSSVRIGDCFLTHLPVHPSEFERCRVNIHGHLHSKVLPDPRYVNVSAEKTGLAPISLEELKSDIMNREEKLTWTNESNSCKTPTGW